MRYKDVSKYATRASDGQLLSWPLKKPDGIELALLQEGTVRRYRKQ